MVFMTVGVVSLRQVTENASGGIFELCRRSGQFMILNKLRSPFKANTASRRGELRGNCILKRPDLLEKLPFSV